MRKEKVTMALKKKKTSVKKKSTIKKPVESEDMASMLLEDSDDANKTAESMGSMEKLGQLSDLCKKQISIEDKISEAEESIKKLKKELADYRDTKIPDIFDELGMSKFSLTDGTEVLVERGFVGNITAKTQKKAFAWLKKNKHGDIIKHDFTVKMKSGQEEQSKELREELELLGVTYAEKSSIHPGTLKAFVNEQMDQGTDIPQDAFNIFPIRKAKIKRK